MTTAAGAEVAGGSGTGTDCRLDLGFGGHAAGLLQRGRRRRSARPRRGILRAGGGALLSRSRASPPSPRRSARTATARPTPPTVTYRITAPANVTVEVTDAIGGVVATLVDRVWTQAGEHTVRSTVRRSPTVTTTSSITARTAAGVRCRARPAERQPHARSGDGRRRRRSHRTGTVERTASRSVHARGAGGGRIRIEREGAGSRARSSALSVPAARLPWDGQRASGLSRRCVPRGRRGDGRIGVISYGVPFVSDTVAPRVRILPGKGLRVEVSEPSTLTFVSTGSPCAARSRRPESPDPWGGSAARVRVVAWDAAGNPSGPVVRIQRRD